MMKYHDIDDKRGKVGIRKEYRDALPGMLKLYDIFKDADALDHFRSDPVVSIRNIFALRLR